MAPYKIERYQKNIVENIEKLRERICIACRRSGRDPEEVRLLLVTESVPPAMVRYVLDSGENRIGEKNGNEWADKRGKLQKYDPEVHFLGTLSRGKLDSVLERSEERRVGKGWRWGGWE